MSSTLPPCPECESTDPNARWGHKITGFYDGIAYWTCSACGHIWARDFDGAIGLQRRADEMVQMARRAQAQFQTKHRHDG